jgi:site-specific recombinase XerD
MFKNLICSQNVKTIDGPAVINYQYYLKKQRQNCGASINRKIFALRSYGNFLKLYDLPCADALPFYDVLKIRQGYRKRPGALTPQKISLLFKVIDTNTILGIRDYAIYALMYQLGLRVGEVHALNLANLDFENSKINVLGKGQKPRTLHMNDELIEILCQYMAVRELFCNSWLTPALFVSKKVTVWQYAPWKIILKRSCVALLSTFLLMLHAIPCDTVWLLTLTIKTLISWSYRAFSVILLLEVLNPISTLLPTESDRPWRNCPVLNLSKNC